MLASKFFPSLLSQSLFACVADTSFVSSQLRRSLLLFLSLRRILNPANPAIMPSLSQVLLLPPLSLVLYFAYQYFGRLRPLNAIPNAHSTAPFSPIWLLSIRYRKRENRTVWESHKRCGPVIRLAPGEISVCTLQGIKTIYGVWDKDVWYEAFINYGSVLFVVSNHFLFLAFIPFWGSGFGGRKMKGHFQHVLLDTTITTRFLSLLSIDFSIPLSPKYAEFCKDSTSGV